MKSVAPSHSNMASQKKPAGRECHDQRPPLAQLHEDHGNPQCFRQGDR
jgi:hypothetical protein